MKTKDSIKIYILIAVVAIFASVIFMSYLVPSDEFLKTKVYEEPLANMTLQIPDSFNIEREILATEEVSLKITAPNDTSRANPGLVNVTVFKRVDSLNLEDQAAAFLSVDKRDLNSFGSQREGYSYYSQSGQTASYYYFFQNQESIVVFKFNRSYFDKSNPMMLIDNSAYANTFLRMLNTVTFS